MKTKHTPTPWIMQKGYMGGFVVTTADQGRNEDFITGTSGDEAYVSEANAAFIVRACNAHDELVAIIEKIMKNDDDLAAGCPEHEICDEKPIREEVEKLLSKARGEA